MVQVGTVVYKRTVVRRREGRGRLYLYGGGQDVEGVVTVGWREDRKVRFLDGDE